MGTRDHFVAAMPDLRVILSRLSARGGVYHVLGDADGSGDHLRGILGSTEVRVPVDEVVRVDLGAPRLTIGGVGLEFDGAEAHAVVERLEESGDEGNVRILLSHRPDAAPGLRTGSRVDLVVAGHAHGGQVVVPGFGPPVTLSRVPRAVAAGSLHGVAGNRVYVSRGLGCKPGQAPRVRFLCPP